MKEIELNKPSEEFTEELLEIIKSSVSIGANNFSIEFDDGTVIELIFKVWRNSNENTVG